jgi:hypothetical protein
VFPIRDNIPTERTPFVTIGLIVANVLMYFLFQHGTITLGDPSSHAFRVNLVQNATIPWELTNWGHYCTLAAGCGAQHNPPGYAPTWATPFLSMFMHGGLLHLGGNMLFLWIFGNNVEVAPRLYPLARRGGNWRRSLRVLRNAKEMAGDAVVTKSGLMVGLGESLDEMVDAFGQLRAKGVQVLTVGQYLRPTERHLPVVRYWHPDEFKALETAAYDLGFEHIAAGPLVRSSYHADEHVKQDRPGVGPVAAAS